MIRLDYESPKPRRQRGPVDLVACGGVAVAVPWAIGAIGTADQPGVLFVVGGGIALFGYAAWRALRR